MTISHWVKLCHKIHIISSIKKRSRKLFLFLWGGGQGRGMRFLALTLKNYVAPSQRFKSSWKCYLFTYCSTFIYIWQNWQWEFLYQILFFSPRKDFIIKAVSLLSISHGCMKKYHLDDARLKKWQVSEKIHMWNMM